MKVTQEYLQQYARSGDEDAFRELVANYFGLVHSIALRRLQGNAFLANDVVQLVFTDLAKKAAQLPKDVLLGGWLHQHTCFVAGKMIRTELRRAHREREAAEMKNLGSNEPPAFSPILDEAIEELPTEDRSALILRFIEGRDLKKVGEALKVSDDAAQKRVQRALEKLRVVLAAKGFTTSTAALSAILIGSETAASTAVVDRISRTALSTVRNSLPLSGVLSGHRLAISVLLVGLGVGLIWWRTSRNALDRQSENFQSKALGITSESPDVVETASLASSSVGTPDETSNLDQGLVQETRVMEVYVTDATTGLPIPGASIRHVLSQSGQGSPSDPIHLTDTQGLAQVPFPAEGTRRFQLTTFHPNYAGWISIWEPGKGDFIPTQHQVSLSRGVNIGGTVLDPGVAPLKDVAVRIYRFWSGSDKIDRSNQRLNISTITNRTDSAGQWSSSHIPENLLEKIGLNFAHPDYAQTNKSIDAGILPMLRAGSFTVVLTKGMNLFGEIRETDGTPVPGAKVSFGRPNTQNRRESTSDENGRYEFKNVTGFPQFGGGEPVTVLAESFTPVVKQVPVTPTTLQLDFVVEPGRSIRGRVLNEAGEPIQGVQVSRENDQFTDEARNEAGIVWSTRTDKEGRFAWVGAPSTPQPFYFGHGSYARLRGKKLAPSEEEHIIVLKRHRYVQGSVRNSHSGELLQEFHVLPASGTPTELGSWSSNDERTFKDGFFQLQLTEEEHNVVQFRAGGFYTTNYLIPPEGQELQAELRPAASLAGIVADPNGQLVSGAEVAALAPIRRKSVAIAKGRFSPSQRDADHTTTDANGQFLIQQSVEASTLIAVSPIGYAEVQLRDSQQQYTLILQPWGKVQGRLLHDQQPLPGVKVTLSAAGPGTENLFLEYASFETVTGLNGEFAFDTVPPRVIKLARLEPMGPRSWQSRDETNLVVRPNQTTDVELRVDSSPASAQ